MSRVSIHVAIVAWIGLALAVPASADIAEDQVLVVYNSASAEASTLLAAYQAAHPGLPAANLLDLNNADLLTSDLTYTQFVDDVRDPIRAYLSAPGAPEPEDIISIVLLRPFPHRLLDTDNPLVGDAPTSAFDELSAGDATYASVDAELVLLWQDLDAGEAGGRMDSPSDNMIDNPYHQSATPIDAFDRSAITEPKTFTNRDDVAWELGGTDTSRLGPGDLYLVCRIDGTTPADAAALIERAGTISVDQAAVRILLDEYDVNARDELDNDSLFTSNGPFLAGDDYEETRDALLATGWDVRYDDTFSFISGAVETTPLVAYASYGENHSQGGAGEDPPGSGTYIEDFNFAPGAIFNTFESYNGRALNGLGTLFNQEQIADFVTAGGTFAIGHVFEPFTFSQPDNEFLFPNMLDQKMRWAEAAYTSLPALSWQQIVLGDPLGQFGEEDEEEEPPTGSNGLENFDLAAKAEPDECFFGLGDPDNTWPWDPADECANAESSGLPKVNQTDAWGMTLAGDQLWFGTAANHQCIIAGARYLAPIPYETEAQVCEFATSAFSPPLPKVVGDHRRPDIFVLDTSPTRNGLTDKSADLDAQGLERLSNTLDLRSAGYHDGVVFLGGPALTGGGVNLFAFDSESGDFLGSRNLRALSNIGQWVVAGDDLYTTAGVIGLWGAVLRWRGDVTEPFHFELVGWFPGAGTYLAVHEDRLFVSTSASPLGWVASGIRMSPPIPSWGLMKFHALWWKQVWSADDYEPDPVTAFTYRGGPLASFGGYLVWGTSQPPKTGMIAHTLAYGAPNDTKDARTNSARAIALFRGRVEPGTGLWGFLNPDFKAELLYGESVLPTFNPDVGTNGAWELVDNNMGEAPLLGPSGFGNELNRMATSMTVFDGELLVGTLDLSQPTSIPGPADAIDDGWGADLWRFTSLDAPAEAEFTNGGGNWSTYAVRSMAADGALYLGMGNNNNKLTNPTDHLPEGGWEVLRLTVPSE